MAAGGKVVKFITAGGIDQRWKPELGTAEDITCARVDPDGLGWLFDRGLEPWWDPGSSLSITASVGTLASYLGGEIVSTFVWSKQNTEQTYYLIEQNGNLYYFLGNKGTNTGSNFYFSDLVLIDEGRHVPAANEPGTQYIPFGNRLLILNGYDKPIWFYGRARSRNFSFSFSTPAPEMLPIQTSYLSGSELEDGVASPVFGQTDHYGIGQVDERNHYDWKISFISDTGSESPLSSPASIDWYPSTSVAEDVKLGAVITDLPIGPDGTVARRIYRTKNQKLSTATGAADSIYYFVKQINENTSRSFIDVVPDGDLVDQAPSASDSVTISGAYQYGASWAGRMWLAGGSPHPTKIIYSKAGLPEQFGSAEYFELGNTAGGAITQIFPYYNNLLIFRQKSIDMVRVTSQGFQVSQLSSEIGTEASNTCRLVPGLGVCFLAADDVYAISGGTEGGSTVRIQRISGTCTKEIERINRSAIQKAVAVYSHKEKEYWIHYPVDGQKFNTRGMVLHTSLGQWSLRHSLTDNDVLFRFSAMAVDPEGNIIIGPRPLWTGSGPGFAGSAARLPGILHVWCGSSRWGSTWTVSSANGETAGYTITDNTKPNNRWESSWIDFGDNSKKHRVFSVEAEILSQGNTGIRCSWAQDYDYAFTSAGIAVQNRPETVNTVDEDPVFGPANTEAKHLFTVGTDALQDGRVTTLRWDVSTKLVQNFKFRLDSVAQKPFHLVSFHIDYNDGNIKPLNQLARANAGQPR